MTEQYESPLAGSGVDLDVLTANERSSVLVVDDEQDTIALLKTILRMAGFNVLGAMDGAEALKKMTSHNPDIVLLDLMMPGMDGWETYKHLRTISETPVIIVSAKSTNEDVVDGLQRGADDYVTKPFHKGELVARVESVLRRTRKPKEISRLVFPEINLTIDLKTQEVFLVETSIHLTAKEFAVLSNLGKHAPAIVSYETIVKNVWGEDTAEAHRRLKYLVYLIRRKFQTVLPDAELIHTVDRFGYKLQTEN